MDALALGVGWQGVVVPALGRGSGKGMVASALGRDWWRRPAGQEAKREVTGW
jgi:hypothetical protein